MAKNKKITILVPFQVSIAPRANVDKAIKDIINCIVDGRWYSMDIDGWQHYQKRISKKENRRI